MGDLKLTLAQDLRTSVESCLSAYEAAGGRGVDAYWDAEACHPMADGKCLQTLATLHRAKLLSLAQFEARADRVIARLESRALPYFDIDDGWTWGLGFSWRDLPPSEPFLITSAVVARGALDCHQEEPASERYLDLLNKCGAGLRTWVHQLALPVGEQSQAIPAYSPGIREPVYNAAAYALATLKLIGDLEGQTNDAADLLPALEWLHSRRVAGLGWTYSPDNPVVDLLHQCYILNALTDAFGARSIEAVTAEMIGQFAGPCCFADAIRLATVSDEAADQRNIRWLRPLGINDQIELLPKPARLWSLGELLVLLSHLGLDGDRSEGWVRLGRRIAENILKRLSSHDDPETRYPRHVMHAIHGLACYLALLRKKAQSSPDATRPKS